ncbi:MAG: thioredoxin [Pyrinomonadaceae bacterium]
MSDFVNEVSDGNFENDVLHADKPVLVDFWAAWCAPCRMLAPTVEAVAEKYASSAQVVKLNVDENPATSQRYGIKGIPTLILFKGGKEEESCRRHFKRGHLSHARKAHQRRQRLRCALNQRDAATGSGNDPV